MFLNIFCIDKKVFAILILLLLFSLGFLLRLDLFSHTAATVYHVDPNRDFVVAQQILNYGEFPLTGPDGHMGSNVNSPFYYYVVALLLLIFGQSVFSLGIANLFIQFFSLVLFYFTTKEFFNRRTAIIALTIVATFEIFVEQSEYLWQPHLMQFFLLSSLFFLGKFYTKKQCCYLYVGIVLFAFSTVLHNSALALIPVFGLFVLALLLYHKMSFTKYILAAFTFFIVELSLYFPPILYHFILERVNTVTDNLNQAVQYQAVQISTDSLTNMSVRTVQFLKYYFKIPYGVIGASLYGLIFFGTLVSFFLRTKTKVVHIVTFLLGAILFMLFIVGSVINVSDSIIFPVRYTSPIFYIFTAVIAVSISYLSVLKYIGTPLSIFLLMVLVSFGAVDLNKKFSHILTHSIQKPYDFFVRSVTVPPENMTEVESVLDAVKRRNFDGNFNIVTFDGEDNKGYFINRYVNEEFWAPILMGTNKKHLVLDDSVFRGYRSVKEPNFIFFRCRYMDTQKCELLMKNYFPNYYIAEDIKKQYRYYIYLLSNEIIHPD